MECGGQDTFTNLYFTHTRTCIRESCAFLGVNDNLTSERYDVQHVAVPCMQYTYMYMYNQIKRIRDRTTTACMHDTVLLSACNSSNTELHCRSA